MKRVNLHIISKNQPGTVYTGYAVVGELNNETLAFFCTEKFNVDDELQVTFTVGKESYQYPVVLFNLHEQMSSGRIMTSLPTEANPFPARKFYRCFARVMVPEVSTKTQDQEIISGLALAPEGTPGLSLATDATSPISELNSENPTSIAA
ncbi:MAG: hypothetical protein H7333_06360 [Bdellovibrionales bacterium]|nr:hypothetical protein [Oligoflexia bacterium]